VLDQPVGKPAVAKTAVAAAKPPSRQAQGSNSDKYKVRKGDTLAEIARRFGTSVRELMDTNNLRNSVIHAGQILLVK
jgi:peptidoglycan lytic transglycosylase D